MGPPSNHTPIIRPQITQITQIKGTEKDKTKYDERTAHKSECESRDALRNLRHLWIGPTGLNKQSPNRSASPLSLCSLTGVALGAFEFRYVTEIQGVLERTAALVTVGAPEA